MVSLAERCDGEGGLTCAEEVAALVIDNGSGMCKAGYVVYVL